MHSRGFHIFLVIIATLVAIVISWSERRSSAHSLEEVIIQRHLLDFRFESRVHHIAESYLVDTRYAGRIRVNKPIKDDHVNIFLFNFDESLPDFLQSNCTSFPKESTIFCDQAIFDSVPDNRLLGDVNVLEYWLVGHEIAHLLFVNLNVDKKYLSFNACKNALAINDFFENCMNLSSLEIQADNFAVSGLPLISAEDWTKAASSILDAIYFYSYPKKDRKLVEINVESNNDGHPDMALRLLSFSRELEKVFQNFPEYLVNDRLSGVKILVRTTSRTPLKILFYDGFYIDEKEDTSWEFERLNRSIEYLFEGKIGYSKSVLGGLCKTEFSENPSAEYIRHLHCESVFGNQVGIPAFFPLDDCRLTENDVDELCYTALILTYELCSRSKKQVSYCPNMKELSRTIEGFQGRQVKRNYFVMRWLALAELNYVYEERGEEQALDWVINANNYFLNNKNKSMAVDLSQLLYEKSLVNENQSFALASLSILRDTYNYSGNLNMAWRVGERLVKMVDDIYEVPHPLHAMSRQDLGRIMNKYGVEFQSFSTQFAQVHFIEHDELVFLGDYPLRNLEGSEILIEAYEKYLLLLSEEDDSENRAAILERAILSLNDAVYSFNVRHKCDESEKYISDLLELIEYPDSIKNISFSPSRILIPVLENYAVTNLCVQSGDLDMALYNQQIVFRMRQEYDSNNIIGLIESIRLLAYIYYALGRQVEARGIAEQYLDLYLNYFGRKPNLEYGTIVQGNPVEFRNLLEGDVDD